MDRTIDIMSKTYGALAGRRVPSVKLKPIPLIQTETDLNVATSGMISV